MPPAKKRTGNPRLDDAEVCALSVEVRWYSNIGTTVSWYWDDTGKRTEGARSPLYTITRKGFEVKTLEEALEALRGTAVVVQNMIRHARQQDAANRDRAEFDKKVDQARPIDTV